MQRARRRNIKKIFTTLSSRREHADELKASRLQLQDYNYKITTIRKIRRDSRGKIIRGKRALCYKQVL